MVRLSGLLSLSLVASLACVESVVAPGLCPEFCPEAEFEVVDSIVNGSVVRDSSFRGYVAAHRASTVQIVGPGLSFDSRAVIKFIPFPDRVRPIPGDSTTAAVLAIDSFTVNLPLVRGNVGSGGVQMALHRLPVSVDTSVSYANLTPNFADSTLIASTAVEEGQETDSLVVTLPTTAFPSLAADDGEIALGVRISVGDSSFINIASQRAGSGAALTRYFKVDSAGVVIDRLDVRRPSLTTLVQDGGAGTAPGTLSVGGVPSARAIVRIEGLEEIFALGDIILATLELVPSEPIVGAPGDSLILIGSPVLADFGRKSPIIETDVDSLSRGGVVVAVGSADTIRVDVTAIVRSWDLDPDLTRTIMLLSRSEGSSFAEARFFSSESAALKPALRVTYVPSVGLGSL